MSDRSRAIAVVFLAALIATLALGAWEWHWRQLGYEPVLYDDRDLWSQHRLEASSVDQDSSITVVGASRIQLAFSTREFERLLPDWHATSLAINGHYPVAVLEDLANDEDVTGIVLVSIDSRGLAHWYRDMSEPWVRHYRRDFGPQRRIERHLLTAAQQSLVIAGSPFNLMRRVSGWIDGQPPPKPYALLQGDRTIAADYELANVPGLRAHFAEALAADYQARPAPSTERWLDDLEPVAAAVETIQERGGRVVFLRMPTADDHWRLDSETYPRSRYWDLLAGRVGAMTIHFQDEPGLAGLDLPDTSHIDQRDRARFTRTLVEILRERDVLP